MNNTGNRYPQATKSVRFKTRKGHCYMLEHQIIITNQRNISLEKAQDIYWWSRVKIGAFMITAGHSLVCASMEFFAEKNLLFSISYLIFALVFAYLAKRQIKKSSVTVIKKRDILAAGYYGARFGRPKSFFEISYCDNLILKSIEIQLPKKNTSQKSNTLKALEIMYEVMD